MAHEALDVGVIQSSPRQGRSLEMTQVMSAKPTVAGESCLYRKADKRLVPMEVLDS